MKIALIGYGKMGKAVEDVLKETPNEVVSVSFKNGDSKLDLSGIKKADVAIDFTSPEIILENIEKVLKVGISIVVGTSGWYQDIPKVKKMVSKYKGSLVYGANFSIGANIFFETVRYATSMLAKFDYDVAGLEMHHKGKKDSPSGTAKKLSDIIMGNMKSKRKLQTGSLNRQIEAGELHFVSLRAGRYFGRHEIYFDSPADEIKLTHEAHNRLGFAKGAIFAAEFVKNKKGFYSFEDIFLKEVGK